MRHSVKMLVAVLAVSLLAVGVSCKKKEDTAPDRTALLTARTWRINQVLLSNTPLTDDLLRQIAGQAGLLGEIYSSNVIFNADGTFRSPSNTALTGSWSFNADQTELTITSGAQSVGFRVVALTATGLELETLQAYTANVPPFGNVSARITLQMVPV
ncbi:MAG: hypothetical protein MUD08_06370 [Cytophagales bacterium]|jgi:hypothetical protein|nr:hypothetical protein [Cytophagales bacterium]